MVDQLTGYEVKRQGVDGEIAPLKVFLKTGSELNAVWAPPVRVVSVNAKRRYLVRVSLKQDRDRPVAQACRNHSFEVPLDLFGKGIGCEVVVLHGALEQKISDRTAHKVDVLANLCELLGKRLQTAKNGFKHEQH